MYKQVSVVLRAADSIRNYFELDPSKNFPNVVKKCGHSAQEAIRFSIQYRQSDKSKQNQMMGELIQGYLTQLTPFITRDSEAALKNREYLKKTLLNSIEKQECRPGFAARFLYRVLTLCVPFENRSGRFFEFDSPNFGMEHFFSESVLLDDAQVKAKLLSCWENNHLNNRIYSICLAMVSEADPFLIVPVQGPLNAYDISVLMLLGIVPCEVHIDRLRSDQNLIWADGKEILPHQLFCHDWAHFAFSEFAELSVLHSISDPVPVMAQWRLMATRFLNHLNQSECLSQLDVEYALAYFILVHELFEYQTGLECDPQFVSIEFAARFINQHDAAALLPKSMQNTKDIRQIKTYLDRIIRQFQINIACANSDLWTTGGHLSGQELVEFYIDQILFYQAPESTVQKWIQDGVSYLSSAQLQSIQSAFLSQQLG